MMDMESLTDRRAAILQRGGDVLCGLDAPSARKGRRRRGRSQSGRAVLHHH